MVSLINPCLKEPYFVTYFIGGLKPDIYPLVQWADPQALLKVYQCAKLHEQSYNSLYKQLTHQFTPKYAYHTNKPTFSLPPPPARVATVVKTKVAGDKKLSFEEC